jgi:hypothetical protein
LRQKWRVIGASRKAPADKTDGELTYLAADLLDAGGLKLAISPYRDITHLFFTARAAHEETGVEPVTENVAMLRNALDAVETTSSILEHVHIVEGTKWYGMHIGNFKTPARENDPRHMPPNFYYDQQDLITERQKGKQWSWSASRPCFLIDFAPNRHTQCGVGDRRLCCNLSRTRGAAQLPWHRCMLEQFERSDRCKATRSRYGVFVNMSEGT